MENLDMLKQEIELLQKKLDLLKLIDELQSKVNAPRIEYVPVYPVYPTYPVPSPGVPYYDRGTADPPPMTWPPIITCQDNIEFYSTDSLTVIG